jgi:two-component system copper resistance phosphate regulon response regulator CusR
MKLLVIEDEIKAAAYLKKGLSENGFIVDITHDGEDGLYLATTFTYDLIILDVMLPKIDGWSLLEKLRLKFIHTPILYLTAMDSTEDRVKGLNLGADDYLIKPFAFSELLARVHNIVRRGHIKVRDILRIADLEVDLIHHKAIRNSKRIDLTAKEFALLSLFVRRAGEVISRTVITEQVWDINFDSDTNTVDVAVRRLRRKVDDPFKLKLIHTIRGVGYVLEIREITSPQ